MSDINIQIIEDNSELILNATSEAIKRALEAVAQTVERYAKENEDRVDTGRLRNSITHVSGRGGGGFHFYQNDAGTNFMQSVGTSDRDDTIYVGTNVEYAPYIEYGTYKKQAANGGKGFLRPALEEHIEEYKHIFETNIKL